MTKMKVMMTTKKMTINESLLNQPPAGFSVTAVGLGELAGTGLANLASATSSASRAALAPDRFLGI
jgi:hypothetical protein